MKKILFLCFLLTKLFAFSQIHVGPEVMVTPFKKKFEPANLEALKKTTTYFVYRETDEEDLKTFKQTLSAAWTHTPIEFISYEEYTSGKARENASYFAISGFYRLNGNLQTIQFYLTLFMELKGETKTFCRIDLHPNWPAASKAQGASTDKAKNEVIENMYTKAIIYNWNLPFLKNALQFVSKKLDNSEYHWLFTGKEYKDISLLKKQTLYIPDYELVKFNKFSGDESKRLSEDDLLKKYPYKYKVLPIDELTDLILTSKDPIYYLSMVRSSTDKYITVFEGLSGEAIYYNYAAVSYNLDSDDFKELLKAIEKPKK